MLDVAFSWQGSFLDKELERKYRQEVWPAIIRHQGILCLIASALYLLAGLCPILEMGFIPKVVFLSVFRVVVSLTGVWLFLYTKSKKIELYPALLNLFILILGCYEAVEAVLTYTPDLEYSTPFTLLLLFILYIIFPLSLAYILPAALFASLLYVACLKIFIVSQWYNLIQLSLFFVAANVLGSYFLILISQSSRKQYVYTQHILQLNEQLKGEVEAKERANAKLEALSVTDPLTQIANRRKLMETAAYEWSQSLRYSRPLSFMIIDVDFFKKVNDSYGHPAGDAVLKSICERIGQALRGVDCFARLGGEEFGIIMPNTHAQDAGQLAERIRTVVSAAPITTEDSSISVTVSIGIAERMLHKDDSLQQLFQRADAGLYLAKQSGRNQVRLQL